MIAKDAHTHEFKTPTEQKVLVSAGQKTAIDILKQRKCKCGKVLTYDLERTIK